MEIRGDECVDVLPDGFSVGTHVYEYGGSPYVVLGGGARVIFSNFSNNSINILNVDTRTVELMISSKTLRYVLFDVYPLDSSWVLAVEEDHEIDVPEKVKNYVVAINATTGEVKRIVDGADFYMFPSFSPDGKKVAWVSWDFPGMPWAGVRLYWADWAEEGGINSGSIELVAGTDTATVTEPRWGPDGYLYFCLEQTNFYQLYRRKVGESESSPLKLEGFERVEFGKPEFACGRFESLSAHHFRKC